MKRHFFAFLTLLLSTGFLSVSAQQPLIASIFNNNNAQIQIPFSATVSDDGTAYFSLPELPVDSRSLTVRTDQDITTYFLEPVENTRFWDELKGQTITLSNGNISITGQLTDVDGKTLTLEDTNGQYIRIPNADAYVLTTSANINTTAEKSTEKLVIHSNLKKGEKITGDLLFETRGLRWESRHTLTIDNELNVTSLFSKAILFNQNNAEINNLTPILVFGEQNNRNNHRDQMMMEMAAMESQKMAYGSVSQDNVGSSGDLFFYRFQDEISLPANAEHHHNLMTARKLESSHLYEVGLQGYDRPDNWMFPQATITVPAKSLEKHIKNALPGGMVSVYMDHGENELMAYTQTSVPVLVNGADLKIPIGEAKTIRVKEEITDRKNITTTITETSYKVTVQNLKEEITNIELTRYLRGNETLIFNNLNFEKSGNRLISTVETGSKQTRTFSYKVRTER
jgi:hypothetical protein